MQMPMEEMRSVPLGVTRSEVTLLADGRGWRLLGRYEWSRMTEHRGQHS